MKAPKKLSVLVVWILAAILVTPACGMAFACGCDWPELGGFANCDALTGQAPPHCPWCAYPASALCSVAFGLAAATAAALKLPLRPADRAKEMLARSGAGTLALLAALWTGAGLTALAVGHPSFLGASLRAAT